MATASDPAGGNKKLPVEIGELVVGKYRIERVLGAGGMGVVVLANHVELDQHVALKFLLPEAIASVEVLARFKREAKAAARIKSAHVARVIDVSEMANGVPFIVMEYMTGRDLDALVREEGPLGVEQAAGYVLEACDALAQAHALGIVHRDLKPSNLFLAEQPDRRSIVKVLDFGISKSIDPATAALTSTQAMLGSPLYMSPEQLMASKHVDARTDLWSLGAVLFELLTGRAPFLAESLPELIAAILAGEPTSLSSLRPDIEPAFAALVHQCLTKDRERRFSTIAAFTTALAPFAPIEKREIAERISRTMGLAVPPISSPSSNALAPTVLAPPSAPSAPSAALAGTGATWGKTQPNALLLPVRKFPIGWLVGGVLLITVVVGTVVAVSAQRSTVPLTTASSVSLAPPSASIMPVADPTPTNSPSPAVSQVASSQPLSPSVKAAPLRKDPPSAVAKQNPPIAPVPPSAVNIPPSDPNMRMDPK